MKIVKYYGDPPNSKRQDVVDNLINLGERPETSLSTLMC